MGLNLYNFHHLLRAILKSSCYDTYVFSEVKLYCSLVLVLTKLKKKKKHLLQSFTIINVSIMGSISCPSLFCLFFFFLTSHFVRLNKNHGTNIIVAVGTLLFEQHCQHLDG